MMKEKVWSLAYHTRGEKDNVTPIIQDMMRGMLRNACVLSDQVSVEMSVRGKGRKRWYMPGKRREKPKMRDGDAAEICPQEPKKKVKSPSRAQPNTRKREPQC